MLLFTVNSVVIKKKVCHLKNSICYKMNRLLCTMLWSVFMNFRAACNIKLEKYDEAMENCNEVSVDNT